MKKRTQRGRVLTVVGWVLSISAMTKMSVIGVYPSEILPTLALALIGAGLIGAANKWHRIEIPPNEPPTEFLIQATDATPDTTSR